MKVPARTVTGISGTVDHAGVLARYDAAMTELDEAVAGRDAPGAPGGRYANELFTAGSGEIGWPIFRLAPR
jgi:hypothetical protein